MASTIVCDMRKITLEKHYRSHCSFVYYYRLRGAFRLSRTGFNNLRFQVLPQKLEHVAVPSLFNYLMECTLYKDFSNFMRFTQT